MVGCVILDLEIELQCRLDQRRKFKRARNADETRDGRGEG